jgi:hypothetical protein
MRGKETNLSFDKSLWIRERILMSPKKKPLLALKWPGTSFVIVSLVSGN